MVVVVVATVVVVVATVVVVVGPTVVVVVATVVVVVGPTVVVVVATVVVVVGPTVVVVVATVVVVVGRTVVVVVATVVVVVGGAVVLVVVAPPHGLGWHDPGPRFVPCRFLHACGAIRLHCCCARQQTTALAPAERAGCASITAIAAAKVTRPRPIKTFVMRASPAVAIVGEEPPALSVPDRLSTFASLLLELRNERAHQIMRPDGSNPLLVGANTQEKAKAKKKKGEYREIRRVTAHSR